MGKFFVCFFISSLFLFNLRVIAQSQQQGVSNIAAPDVWFKGSAESAFETAKKDNKPVFLYFGAVWCHYCSELKAQIFLHPDFSEIMKSAVPVYMDADTDAGQSWADKLKIRGYPTLIIFSPEGKEIARIDPGSFDEFADALKNAIVAGKPVAEIYQMALKGEATETDWKILRYANWDRDKTLNLSEQDIIKALQSFADKIPATLVKDRAAMVGGLLGVVVDNIDSKDEKIKALIKQIKVDVPKYLDVVLANEDSIIAARNFVLFGGVKLVNWAFPDKQDLPKKKTYDDRVLKAAQVIRDNPQMSLLTKLSTVRPKIDLAKQKNQKKVVLPKELKQEVKKLALDTLEKSKDNHIEHNSILSTATRMLCQAGECKKAKAVLLEELKTTDMPYDIEANIADIEDTAGHKKEALNWLDKARIDAKDNSESFMLLSWEIEGLQDVTPKDMAGTRAKILKELVPIFYEGVFKRSDRYFASLPDSDEFNKKMAKTLKPLLKDASFKTKIQDFSKKCETFKDQVKTNCITHFNEVLKI